MDPFILVTIKLLVGFFALVIIINVSGKGNLAPSSASDQITNYVLGGIIGGVIYNNSISIYDFIIILGIWCVLVLSMKWIKQHSVKAKQLIDGKAMIILKIARELVFQRMTFPLSCVRMGSIRPKVLRGRLLNKTVN